MNFANAISAALALLSFAILLWQWIAARKFPLHRRDAGNSFSPAVTLLKPVKGCDATTGDSLRSWFNQNYSGAIQIIFGIADANDPAAKIIAEVIAENPKSDARLVVCENLVGANAKVAKLAQLETLARHELILVSDADVRVPPDFLANVVAPLRDEKFGLVNCFYRLANPTTSAMNCEAVAINADFWSQVLQSQMLKPLDFALGAVMLTRKNLLAQIGGFKSLANCLADDYQLGNRIAKGGHRIALCPVVVECWDAPANWSGVWKHQLRWARTIRVCQPLPYFFSILSNATFWPLLWLICEFPQLSLKTAHHQLGNETTLGFTFSFNFAWAALIALAFCCFRIFVAYNLQRRFTPETKLVSPFWLVPAKDLLQAAIWFAAFAGNTVEWRGRKMKLRRDGTLID